MGSAPFRAFTYSAAPSQSPVSNGTLIYRHPECLSGLKSSPSPQIQTLQDILNNAYKKFGSKRFLGTIRNSVFEWRSYEEGLDRAKLLGSGLISLGLQPNRADYEESDLRFVGIYSKNREEAFFTEMACIFYGWVSLPIYDTLGPEAMDFIFEQTCVELLFCSAENLVKLIKEKRFGKLKTIVTFEKVNDLKGNEAFSERGIKIWNFEEILDQGKQKPHEISNNIKPDSVFSFSYTSGTTGKPKGAMLTHGNLVSVVANAAQFDITENDIYLSYLPMAHILEKLILVAMIYYGCSVGFYQGDVQKLKDDLLLLKPTIFVTVPRLLLKFHDVIKSGFERLKGCKKSLVEKAVRKKLQYLQSKGKVRHSFYDRMVFKKVRMALGGNVRWLLVGSAPMNPEVLKFLKIAFCCNIMEGYGQTESSGASFMTQIADNRSAGHVGGPCLNTEFKLVDVPDMNYTSKDADERGVLRPRGEICLRGPAVFKGYYQDQVKTREAIDEDGWLHTGDIGMICPNGSLKIIDRKKNIFKLSHGEYVAAEKIENVYLQNKVITEIFVYGDSLQSFLIAIVVPNMSMIMEYAKKANLLTEKPEEILRKKEIKGYVLGEMNKTGKEAKLLGFELVKNIYLEQESFALKDVMTSTFKLKRHDAKLLYQKIIDQLYAENPGV